MSRPPSYHRRYIEGMTDAEAVEYLLGVLDADHAMRSELHARIKDHMPSATRRDVLVLATLWEARPRIVTYGTMSQHIEHMTGEWPDKLAIASSLRRLRRALERTDHPIRIRTHSGIGCNLVAPDDWIAPWDDKEAR